MEEELIKEYSNGEVTIVWQPAKCAHSRICWTKTAGLPQVFNPMTKPWINPNGASTAEIIAQVNKCPSGALSYFLNERKE